MASVNMSNVNFYIPHIVLKPPHKQPEVSTSNKHRRYIQPVVSQPLALRNDQDNDSSDDSLPSLDELLRPSQNEDSPQMPPQNYNLLYRLKQELADVGHLLTNPTPNSIYVLGNSQGRFLGSLLYTCIPY